MAASMAPAASLKEYLRRYESTNDEEKKKKKKKKKAKADGTGGVIVVDEDPIWQKQVKLEEENDELADDDEPQVNEDIEVKRMKRLEQIKSRRPFGAISEDGSGWVPISDTPQDLIDDNNSDISPPHNRRSPSLQQRKRYHSPSPEPEIKPLPHTDHVDSDMSPPRKRRARYDTPSPEPDSRPLKSDGKNMDLSPPRHSRKYHHTKSQEPEIKPSHYSDPDLDLSPHRRHRAQKLTGNESKKLDAPDISPPRQGHRSFSNRGDSLVSSATDLSPPRKSRKDIDGSLDVPRPRSVRHSTEVNSDLSPPRKVRPESTSLTEWPRTGLVTGRDIKEEIDKKKKEDLLRFKRMDPSISGRGADPIYRDKKTGERLTSDQIAAAEAQKKEAKEKPKEIKVEWGKGLAQKREAEARQQELELEKAKPFARTRDDPDLDKMLKERVRWGDPMAHLVKRRHSEMVLPDLGDDEKMKESGFIIPQGIPNHSWLKRGLDAAPNRYNIKPGRHWDGVDRSTGFEKELVKRMNEKQAREKEAYLWSVSDM
ncbi:hypothetical protein RJ639_008306 [Escallonia herrerae]|uniref:BUD13 homolog n=1 Tax=Escallonia herrerae TaxID=1293975 RepID=A0AA88VU24_9ASTE|nr:hypothetical protein RJ639_008306 [Escallonia herrerae]